MGYGGADASFPMPNGYTVSINWSVYPTATITRGGERIAKKDWVLFSGLGFGPWVIHRRIERWAIKAVRRHERMERRFATFKSKFPVAVEQSYNLRDSGKGSM